ncbi:MAG TPA: P27 family phage terminase small subunit [Acetobacteraceae bacterium]|jgi:P27 family predicted phage terminase small subunit|nr:P27 family phage terminase small subunit [Acetobacteraceae bacterium]
MTTKSGAGRRPKPTALHTLHGTMRSRHRKERAYEPRPVGDLTDAPDWFNESQREGWNYVMRHAPPGMLKCLDRGLMVLWVEAEDRHRIATMTQDALNAKSGNKLPYLVKSPLGMIASPYIDIIDRAAKIMFRCADSLGFSPVARPRIKMDAPQGENDAPQSPWAQLQVIDGGKAG